ncbi:hypothetical protein ARMGADRAFT_950564 [Armillaria gallica]|uniref:Uncharacterized protein n=1 Tax=Armillaria gallica TaxID=47427 RepID=A0A2H3CMN6_ARMGA|nr:hypothetical protein ARMGADRAFT_950564 [Armillaria gallica]
MSQQQQQQSSPPRKPCTHISDTINRALRKLSLAAKLERNCKIEAENLSREAKTIKHLDDPAQNPDPGSEMASLISLDNNDIQALRTPTFTSNFPNIPMAIQKTIAQLEAKEKDMASKKRDADDTLLILLPFFLNVNLQWFIDKRATLPTTKTNPQVGESKGSFIIDVEKAWSFLLCSTKEADMTYGQWHEAADNCYRFNAGHDKVGENGPYAKWWEQHFGFFDAQIDKIEQYPAWQSLEKKLRKAYRSQPMTFSRDFYAEEYRMAKLEHRMQLRFEAA